MRVTYWSVFCNRSAICPPTSVPMAPMNAPSARITPNRMVIVALPRFHPRAARLLAAGSIASDRNSATSSSTKKFESRENDDLSTSVRS